MPLSLRLHKVIGSLGSSSPASSGFWVLQSVSSVWFVSSQKENVMPALLIQFIVIAVLSAIGLWGLSQFPTLDGTIVKFIRIAVFVVLSVLLLNLLLVVLLGKSL